MPSLTASELRGLGRLAGGLRRFADDRLSPEDCDQRVRERMRTRESRFLSLLDRCVFDRPQSPYNRLLELAGAEPEEVRVLVRSERGCAREAVEI